MTTPRRHQRVALIAVAFLGGCALNSAFAASPPAWQANVYYPVGTVVSYQGHAYAALISQIDYATSGWNPNAPSLWKRLGSDSTNSDTGTEAAMTALYELAEPGIVRASDQKSAGCALTWNSTNVYTTGGVASVGGVNYKARWWTRGEDPPSHSGEIDQPWAVVGNCGSVSPAVEANDSNESPKPTDTGAGQRAAQASAARDRG
jgi:chitinase